PPFRSPSANPGGWPPLLKLKRLAPIVIDSVGVVRGAFVNFNQPTPYQNLAVPGAVVADVLNILLNYDPTLGPHLPFFHNILRERHHTIPPTLLPLASPRTPTFISLECGSSETLPAAWHGRGTPLPPATFSALLTGTLNAVDAATPNAKKAIFNVPDVTTFPYFNTLPIVELKA